MEYRLSRLIGLKAQEEGWDEIRLKNKIGLKNSSEIIELQFNREKITVKITGNGEVLIKRGEILAKLRDGNSGEIKEGDEIWLLNEIAKNEFERGERENFEGGAIKIEIFKNKTNIFIKENSQSLEKNNNKTNFVLGFIVLGLLITGTILGYQKRTQNEQKNIIEETKNQISKIKTEIEGVKMINIETALQLAKEAESIISEIKVVDKKYNEELEELKKEIEEIKKGLGEESIDYEIVYDTGLIVEGGKFKGMTVFDNLVYLWSNDLGQVNSVDIKLKSTEKIVSDDRIKLWLGIFSSGNSRYGFDHKKIYEIKRNNLVEREIKEINNLGEINGWNGLFYALNNDDQKIEKLSGKNGIGWLKEGVNLKEETTGMAIDGDIWVLGKSGKIYHYSRGEEIKYEMSFIPNLTTTRSLKTTGEVNFLAFVADNNTIYIYHKDGTILGKNNFGKTIINDIGIDSQNQAILALAADGKIYRIKIK